MDVLGYLHGVSPSLITLTVFGIAEIEALAFIPFGTLIALGRDAAGAFEEFSQMHEIPRHEGGVAVGEIVIEADMAALAVVVTVTGAGADLTDPAGVGLRRDDATQVLQTI